MQYSTDPKSGNKLSVLGFGCMRFPRDKSLTEKLIISAVENGINYFDTAYVYPGSELTLGGILNKNDLRERVFLATKLPFSQCKTYDDFDRIFDEQLGRLKTTYIDYYLIHNISGSDFWFALCDMGIEKWIAEKKASAQIRQLGFSFHGSQNGFMDLLDAYDWDFCQIQYNYMDENYQAGRAGLERAREKGIAVIIMEPLLGGKLATGLPKNAERLFKEYDAERTMASWAFRWLYNQPGVSLVLSGMNSEAQLEDNIKTAGEARVDMLTYEETALFAPVIEILREAYKIPCTACNYCMPCPSGVNIPGCFAAYNTSYAMGYLSGLAMQLTSTGGGNPNRKNSAKDCVKCGACEPKCPQNIEIMRELKSVNKRMNPAWLSGLVWLARKILSRNKRKQNGVEKGISNVV